MPINRHPALIKLSQDHHEFLVAAQNIRWLMDGDERATNAGDVVESLLKFWNQGGELHLREEEEVAYPFYLQHVPLAKKEIDALKTDHMWLRDKFEELTHMPHFENTTPLLRSLGEYMVSHIRYEEQVIYEKIQDTLDESALEELAAKSAAFRQEHRGEEPVHETKVKLPTTGLLTLKLDD
ncbi:MAG: hemerythrin domain-containing protein [Anaerolineae bacterium]|nr:hemerythrin domain-containing protein [Anaerolineae bacterium]MDQ7037511.1 hemerythrin domain-containing protein [Anaerolineae bacterium]